MKTPRFTPLPLLLTGLVLGGAGLTVSAQAQPATTTKPKAAKPAAKMPTARKPRLKNLLPRMITATEEAMGKTMTPELKEQLTTALRARETAIQEANRVYYEAYAGATGLTPQQAKEIDKPSDKAGNADMKKADMKKTDMDQLTDTDETDESTPKTPAGQR